MEGQPTGLGAKCPHVLVSQLLPPWDLLHRGLRACHGHKHRPFSELGLGGDQLSSNNTEQESIHVQVTRPGHDAYKSLSLPRTHGDLYEMIVVPQSHPPRALLLGSSLRHAARPSPTPAGPSLGYPGEGPGRLTLLQQHRRGPESRSLGLACSSLRCRET